MDYTKLLNIEIQGISLNSWVFKVGDNQVIIMKKCEKDTKGQFRVKENQADRKPAVRIPFLIKKDW